MASGRCCSNCRTRSTMPSGRRLSPRNMTKGSRPRNSSDTSTAWASPQGRRLRDVGHLETPRRAVADDVPELAGAVADDEAHLADAGVAHGLEGEEDDRLVGHRHELLGARVRDGAQPAALAARQDESPHPAEDRVRPPRRAQRPAPLRAPARRSSPAAPGGLASAASRRRRRRRRRRLAFEGASAVDPSGVSGLRRGRLGGGALRRLLLDRGCLRGRRRGLPCRRARWRLRLALARASRWTCAGTLLASAVARRSGSRPKSLRAASMVRLARASCGEAARRAGPPRPRTRPGWRPSPGAWPACGAPRPATQARPRTSSRPFGSAVATRYCASRAARASRQVQPSRCESEPGKPPSPRARSRIRAPWARSAAQVGAASIRRTTRSTVFESGRREARSPRAARRSERCLHSAAQVAKKATRVASSTLVRVSVRRVQVVGRDLARGHLGPELLLVGRQPVGGDDLPVLEDDRLAPGHDRR